MMGVTVKPIKVTFAVKAEKAVQFRNQSQKKVIGGIQRKAGRIKNITVAESAYGKKK